MHATSPVACGHAQARAQLHTLGVESRGAASERNGLLALETARLGALTRSGAPLRHCDHSGHPDFAVRSSGVHVNRYGPMAPQSRFLRTLRRDAKPSACSCARAWAGLHATGDVACIWTQIRAEPYATTVGKRPMGPAHRRHAHPCCCADAGGRWGTGQGVCCCDCGAQADRLAFMRTPTAARQRQGGPRDGWVVVIRAGY